MGDLESSEGSDADFGALGPRPFVCSFAGLEGMALYRIEAGSFKKRLTSCGYKSA
jgi:hypothetical protein